MARAHCRNAFVAVTMACVCVLGLGRGALGACTVTAPESVNALSEAGISSEFGRAVSVDGVTGDRVAIGAPGERLAYVYVWVPEVGAWALEAVLEPPAGSPVDDRFGASIALEGSIVVVGAPGAGGAAYVYSNDAPGGAGQWLFESALAAQPGATGDFGRRVSLDATTGPAGFERARVVIAAEAGFNSGSVAVFRRDARSQWEAEQEIVGANFTVFGSDATIRDDVLAIGQPGQSSEQGVVFVYAPVFTDGAAQWQLVNAAGFQPSDPADREKFGLSVDAAVAPAGGDVSAMVVVGGEHPGGRAFLLERDGAGGWTLNPTALTPAIAGGAFARRVAIDARGFVICVGAQDAAEIFTREPDQTGATAWTRRARLGGESSFADAVDASGLGAFFGVPQRTDSNGFATGGVSFSRLAGGCAGPGCDDCNGNSVADCVEIAINPMLDQLPAPGDGVIDACQGFDVSVWSGVIGDLVCDDLNWSLPISETRSALFPEGTLLPSGVMNCLWRVRSVRAMGSLVTIDRQADLDGFEYTVTVQEGEPAVRVESTEGSPARLEFVRGVHGPKESNDADLEIDGTLGPAEVIADRRRAEFVVSDGAAMTGVSTIRLRGSSALRLLDGVVNAFRVDVESLDDPNSLLEVRGNAARLSLLQELTVRGGRVEVEDGGVIQTASAVTVEPGGSVSLDGEVAALRVLNVGRMSVPPGGQAVVRGDFTMSLLNESGRSRQGALSVPFTTPPDATDPPPVQIEGDAELGGTLELTLDFDGALLQPGAFGVISAVGGDAGRFSIVTIDPPDNLPDDLVVNSRVVQSPLRSGFDVLVDIVPGSFGVALDGETGEVAIEDQTVVDAQIADIDDDGRDDVVMLTEGSAGGVLRTLVRTRRPLTDADNFVFNETAADAGLAALTIGDMDGDGSLDALVASNDDALPAVTVLYGDGSGAFDPLDAETVLVGLDPMSSTTLVVDVEVADFDDDGDLDFIIADQSAAALPPDGRIEYWSNVGGRNFQRATSTDIDGRRPKTIRPGSTSPNETRAGEGVVVAAILEDGAGQASLEVYAVSPPSGADPLQAGLIGAASNLGADPASLLVVDLDGGDNAQGLRFPEFIIGLRGGMGADEQDVVVVSVLEGADGLPTLDAPARLPLGEPAAAAAAVDWDSDGDKDLALLGAGGGLFIFRNDSNPDAAGAVLLSRIDDAPPAPAGAVRVLTGDLDEDGDADLLLLSETFDALRAAPVIRADLTASKSAGRTADLNADGAVNGADLGLLLGAWGESGPADLNDDGVTDGADLGLLLGAWG